MPGARSRSSCRQPGRPSGPKTGPEASTGCSGPPQTRCPPDIEDTNVLGHTTCGPGELEFLPMRGRIAFGSSFLALCLAIGLIPVAFWAPMYSNGGTLVGVNGPGVLIPVGIPFVLAAVAFVGLWLKCSRGSVAGERAA